MLLHVPIYKPHKLKVINSFLLLTAISTQAACIHQVVSNSIPRHTHAGLQQLRRLRLSSIHINVGGFTIPHWMLLRENICADIAVLLQEHDSKLAPGKV